jgi:hypothetical protein
MRYPSNVDLNGLFLSLQKQLTAKMLTTRGFVHHDPTKGAAAEQAWLAVLNGYLPQRYRADSAFVVDWRGRLSEQIDVVIYDRQYSPLILQQDGVLYVPAESVYAVFDVKHEFRRPAIMEAAEKAESVRRLKRTTVPVRFVAGTYKPKALFEITAGILCIESSWADTKEAVQKILNEVTTAGFLNLGCAVRDGSFEARKTKRDVEVETSTRETALIFFFLRLLHRLQQMGTVPAMDIMKYAANLGRRKSKDGG